MKLYVDDIRPAPPGWVYATNYDEAIKILEIHQLIIDEISLDHDLGEDKTGYDICKWMVEKDIFPATIRFHTSNPVGRYNMYQLLEHYAPEGVDVIHDNSFFPL